MMQVINSISIDAVVVNQHMHTQMPLRSLAWHGTVAVFVKYCSENIKCSFGLTLNWLRWAFGSKAMIVLHALMVNQLMPSK